MKMSPSSLVLPVGALALAVSAGLIISTLSGGLLPGKGPGVSQPDGPEPFSGKRLCLSQVSPLDHRPGVEWSASWNRLEEKDCRSGSWLHQFRESGQNLAEYQEALGADWEVPSTVSLVPLGTIEKAQAAELLEPVREFLEIYFQTPVSRSARVPMPPGAFRPEKGVRGQLDAEHIVQLLKGLCPTDTEFCLAVTDGDLFVDGLQYVLGLGHFKDRVGIFSTYRLWEKQRDGVTGQSSPVRDPEPLRRALKVAVHELSHELAVAHCAHYRGCVMAGTNSLLESDRGRLTLCPLDHRKLQGSLGFDPHRRFSQLAGFAQRYGLFPEARYWETLAREYPRWPNASGAAGFAPADEVEVSD